MELEKLALQLCQPLSPLDREIIRGAIIGESYQAIADRLWYCHEHVRERGAALFQQVSIRLGRDVSKRNFREELERVRRIFLEKSYRQGAIATRIMEVTSLYIGATDNAKRNLHRTPAQKLSR